MAKTQVLREFIIGETTVKGTKVPIPRMQQRLDSYWTGCVQAFS